MANIYLGLVESGTEAILLPPVRWINGNDPGIPTDRSNQVDKATMLDGSKHHNFREHSPARWNLQWEMLTATELALLLSLKNRRVALDFQNNWESDAWYQVIISDFQFTPILRLGSAACRYNVMMLIEQTGS